MKDNDETDTVIIIKTSHFLFLKIYSIKRCLSTFRENRPYAKDTVPLQPRCPPTPTPEFTMYRICLCIHLNFREASDNPEVRPRKWEIHVCKDWYLRGPNSHATPPCFIQYLLYSWTQFAVWRIQVESLHERADTCMQAYVNAYTNTCV